MSKYSKELIISYINGDDLGNYSVDELENDKYFMMKVIEYSNDKEMYNLCSDSVKKAYEFVKYMVLKFKNDISFIKNVADYFLDNTNIDYERIELVIIMEELTKDIKYNAISEAIYSGKRVLFELSKVKDGEVKRSIGYGFLLIYDSYNHSEIILKYYAKKMIEEILSECDLEKILHERFRRPEDINSSGINNCMLSIVERCDSMLASFASAHLDVLIPFRERIVNIQKNWDRYISMVERKKYKDMLDKIYEYMEEVDSIFTETFLIYYIGKKLGIIEKIKQYDCISDEMYEYIVQELDDDSEDFVDQTLKTSAVDRTCYNTVYNIMTTSLYGNSKPKESTDEKKTNRCRVLKLDLNSKKEEANK